jgi:hypothetical protein
MTEHLNELATHLLSIFAGFFRSQQTQLRFEKTKDANSDLTGISFFEPAPSPKASYQDMNTALLSLHHAGYIVYGTNIIKLTECSIYNGDVLANMERAL